MEPTNAAEMGIIEKIRALPPDKLSQVEDFIDFLSARDEARKMSQAVSQLSQGVLARIWDNDEDDAYNEL